MFQFWLGQVFDLGGGTFDVSVLQIEDGPAAAFMHIALLLWRGRTPPDVAFKGSFAAKRREKV